MNRRNFLRGVLAGGTLLYVGNLPLRLLASDKKKVITFLHTNDIHCHIDPFSGTDERTNGKGGLARISEFAEMVRKENPNTLLFDAGDRFQGTPYFNFYKGELIMKTMTKMGYDAGTIGNHEFDNGLEGISDSLKYTGFPLICSNYDFSRTILAGKFPRYKIFHKSGVKIGVYGLGVELNGLVAAKNCKDVVYNDPVQTAIEMESFLKLNHNCDLVVCLSHLGIRSEGKNPSDMVVASETSHTNLIIGGHSHTFLEKPLELKNKTGEPVIVNQAWWGGLMVGRVDFILDEANRKTAVFANKMNG